MTRKQRCRCGNKVPAKELAATGVCRACTREQIEKGLARQELEHRQQLYAKYVGQHPFAAYIDREEL